MAKRLRKSKGSEIEIESEYLEYAVEYDLFGTTMTTDPTDDEDEARLMLAALGGKLIARQVFETSWADGPL